MGRAIALRLAAEGVAIIVVALPSDPASIEETVRQIEAQGGRAVGIAGDLTKEDDVYRAVSEGSSAVGAPDIVVINVAGPAGGYFDDVASKDFAVAIPEMSMSLVYLTTAVVQHMKQQTWGRIVILNSVVAKEPPPDIGHVLAAPARAAATGLAKALSNEFGPFGITVNTVNAGFIGTERFHARAKALAASRGVSYEDELHERMSGVPAGRVGDPEEIAAAVAFLSSEPAGYITGETVAVDGGYHRSAF